MLFAAAPSKVPFYIAGGLLAAWAVLVAINGIRRPDFPDSGRGRLGVLATSAVLVLATISTAILTAGEEHEGEAAGAATSSQLDLTADPDGAASFDKAEATVKAGTVTVTLVNDSALEHNVAVAQGSRELARSDTITGSETELEAELRPGEYEFYCTVDGHRAAGMEGTLTVR